MPVICMYIQAGSGRREPNPRINAFNQNNDLSGLAKSLLRIVAIDIASGVADRHAYLLSDGSVSPRKNSPANSKVF